MEQPALTPQAQDTQPRSVCDLASPLIYCFVIRGHKERMLWWYQNRPARFSCCQPLGKPSGHRLPVLWPHWLLGIPGPWHAAKVKTELRLLSHILPPPLGLHLISGFATCLISACPDSEEPAEREHCQRRGVLHEAHPPPLPQVPHWSSRVRAACRNGSWSFTCSGLTVPAEIDSRKDISPYSLSS